MIIVSPQQKRLLIASAVVWGLAFLVALFKSHFRASKSMTVAVVTQPKNVKIRVNGRFLQNGRYLVTPVSVILKPGKNEIKISRDGYRSHITTIEKIEGEKLVLSEITLLKKSDFATVSVEVLGDRITNPYYVDIDKGFLHGETPLVGTDLPRKGTHVLEIYPDGIPTGNKVKCTLTLGDQATSSGDKLRVKISRKSDGSLQASGCQMVSEAAEDPAPSSLEGKR